MYEPAFWSQLGDFKLHVLRLSEQSSDIQGYYSMGNGLSCSKPMLSIDAQHPGLVWSPSETKKGAPWCPVQGKVTCLNTLEQLNTIDRFAISQEAGECIMQSIISEAAIDAPHLLSSFVLLVYADLKSFTYHHRIAFPVVQVGEPIQLEDGIMTAKKMLGVDGEEEDALVRMLDSKQTLWKCDEIASSCAMLYRKRDGKTFHLENLRYWKDNKETMEKDEDMFLVFWDPCKAEEYPSWPLRNILALMAYHSHESSLRVLCIRSKSSTVDLNKSLGFRVRLSQGVSKVIQGWEGKKPRITNLGPSMNPRRLAASAVDLNIKLMKWRALPSLDDSKMAKVKCLLLGSGTLGCSVARCLLGWGVRNITMVDNSKVSFSNPVRQSLFEYSDCLEGGRPKAIAAADALKRIFPDCHAQGIQLHIPMPGHISTVEEVAKSTSMLDQLVQDHDVIFMLLDTRESRWAPTLLCAAYNKIAITAALGFDSFLVMRHGYGPNSSPPTGTSAQEIVRLGCYFCNDIVAPQNSTLDRSMDQQCTVARPGLSAITGSLAAEILAALVQHPSGIYASPLGLQEAQNKSSLDQEAPLGDVPHMIRGQLQGFSQQCFTGKSFSMCPACSSAVVDEYMSRGVDMILEATSKPEILEEICGLKGLHLSCEDDIHWASDDDGSSDGWAEL